MDYSTTQRTVPSPMISLRPRYGMIGSLHVERSHSCPAEIGQVTVQKATDGRLTGAAGSAPSRRAQPLSAVLRLVATTQLLVFGVDHRARAPGATAPATTRGSRSSQETSGGFA